MPDESDTPKLVKVVVNQATCIGSGQCEMIEMGTFRIDDARVVAEVVGAGWLPADRAERVIDACPSQSISVDERE